MSNLPPAADAKNLSDTLPCLPAVPPPLVVPASAVVANASSRFIPVMPLGHGNMGDVTLEYDRDLARLVAKKTSRDPLEDDAQDRILDEARKTSAVGHPAIITIYECPIINGQRAILMEFARRGSIERLTRKKISLSPEEAAFLVATVADAIDAAHKAGLLHRDIKPSNILIMLNGLIKMADFGLGMHLANGSGLTLKGDGVGTPQAMSPQQWSRELGPVDEAADVWALAVLLYMLLKGQPLFGGSALDILRVVTGTEEGLDRHVKQATEEMPEKMRTILRANLVRDPNPRMSAGELACALHDCHNPRWHGGIKGLEIEKHLPLLDVPVAVAC